MSFENTHAWRSTTIAMKRKPTVLCDVDEVLAAFTSAVLDLVYEDTGKRYQPDDVKTWEIFDSIENKEVQKRVYAKMKVRGGCSAISVIPGSQDAIARLKERCELIIVTSPFWGSETWMHEREEWIWKHFGIPAKDVIHARKKYHIAGDFFIDDKPDHIRMWSQRFPDGHGLLWSTPANRSITDLKKLSSWDELFQLLPE